MFIRYVLHHFLGAPVDELTYESMKMFLLGAIARAFRPHLINILSGFLLVFEDMNLHLCPVRLNWNESSISGTVKRQESLLLDVPPNTHCLGRSRAYTA